MKPARVDWEEFLHGFVPPRPLAVTIGVFDGLHAGHRELVRRIVARQPGCAPTVVTFKVNPKKILRPHGFEGDLLSLNRKLEIMGELGVEVAVLIDFSGDFSTMPGRNFLSTVVDRGRVAYMAVGWDFHCGRGRDTDARALVDFCASRSVDAELLDPVSFHGDTASSTRIRRAVRAGRISEAERLLGRPFEVELGACTGGEDGAWRFAPPEGMVRPPAGLWPVAGREGEAWLRIGAGDLEIGGMRRSEIGHRVPITSLEKNEAIDKE